MAMEKSDLDKCTDIFIKTFNDEPWNERWNSDTALNRLQAFYNTPGRHALVVQRDNLLIGFLIGALEYCSDHKSFYIKEMCILPDFQRKGTGKKLFSEFREILVDLGVKSSYLITLRNTLSEIFYKQIGFSQIDFLTILGKDL